MEAVLSSSRSFAQGPTSAFSCSCNGKSQKASGTFLNNAGWSTSSSIFSESLQNRQTVLKSKRRCTGRIAASYSHGGHGGGSEQPAWGNITDQDLALLRERIQIMKEKERQLRISISWFGKDMEASFFRPQEVGTQAQLAGSNLSWNNNPMIMSFLSMMPLYLIYIAFMFGCFTNHGVEIPS